MKKQQEQTIEVIVGIIFSIILISTLADTFVNFSIGLNLVILTAVLLVVGLSIIIATILIKVIEIFEVIFR